MKNIFNSLKYIIKEHSLLDRAVRDLQKTTALDLSFQCGQVDPPASRWENKHKTKYITSLITGMAPSAIIVANTQECINDLHYSSEDYKYFKKWIDKNYDYVSIDGNNRTNTISEYLSGKVLVEHGDYILNDGTVQSIDKNNDTWFKHPKKFREHIEEKVKVVIVEYLNATRSDLSYLFMNINDGITLNDQEKRNATLNIFSETVRNLSQDLHETFLSKIFKDPKSVIRRRTDEYIVEMFVWLTYGSSKGVGKKEKNEAYEDNSAVHKKMMDNEKIITSFAKFIHRVSDKALKNKSTLFNLFMTWVYVNRNNFAIKDEKKFYVWFMERENRRLGDKKIICTTDKGESRTYSSCCGTLSPLELKSREEYLIKDLNSGVGKVIDHKDGNRFFSLTDRYEMWKKQKGKCPVTGKKIPESEINDDSKWHADHIIPFSKGGKTIIENGQLICKTANLKKSNKLELVN